MSLSILNKLALWGVAAAVVGNPAVRAQDLPLQGPECRDLAPQLSGHVIRTRHGNEILALSLPARKETLLYRAAAKSADQPATIHGVSGPDAEDRIAYLEDRPLGNNRIRHQLKTMQHDGSSDREICSTEAAAGELGTHLALSPTDGRVALLQQLSAVPMPERVLWEGELEIWDLPTGKKLAVSVRALDQPLSWFPDGRHLAFTKLIDRDELPTNAVGLDTFGLYKGQEWGRVPVTCRFDIETAEEQLLHVGWTPIVACDGRSVLVGGWNQWGKFSWNRLDLETKESSPVQWPGNVGGAIAIANGNIVLYTGQATAVPKLTKPGRIARARPALTLKVAALATQQFQTLLPSIEDRDFVSFGQAR